MQRRAESDARILVVDDSRLIREMVSDALASRGRVESVASAEDCLTALARSGADLVVSDLEMSGLSGKELLERIRREHPGTDFVLFTGNASVESAVAALRLGAADYLMKPLRPEELQHVVDRILSHRRLIAENQRLSESLRVAEACRTLTRCLDASEVYAVALDLVLHNFDRTRGVAIFRRTALALSDGVAFRGFSDSEENALRTALSGDKPLDLEHLDAPRLLREGPYHDALREAGVQVERLLAVPLHGGAGERGVLLACEGELAFEADELERAASIAAHANLALQNAERYSQAKERAFIDDVTEVYNARYLHQCVSHEIQRADRYGKHLCILFLDLDRFKLVNDNYGHLVGSQVLVRLSEVLRDCIRQVDTLARYGGDEFTIVLPDTSLEAGLVVGERIRKTVSETIFEAGRNRPIQLTLSLGVAAFPLHARDREGLLDAADKAMYRAKSQGRNRVCSASELAG
jgi:diguanylate cyclase (GGDEF)-like protein